MLHRSTIQLLRFHFSFFLLPVFLFALSQAEQIVWENAIAAFIILHVLVYPASNGYNSYMDRDDSPIGGLKSPLQPTRQLFVITILMDVVAVILALVFDYYFALGILLYIIASRAYSYRGIRLKKYPVIGFLTVFIFQGGWIYFVSSFIFNSQEHLNIEWLPCIIASLLIGALYPLTQIYQHKEDKEDGVTTLSMLLGKKGTFLFSGILFIAATGLLYILFRKQQALNHFYIFMIIMLPVVLFFLYWFSRVWKDKDEANFKNSFSMNLLSTFCTIIFFIYLIIKNH